MADIFLAAAPWFEGWTLHDVDWAAANPFDFDRDTFLLLYAGLIVAVTMVTWLFRDMVRTTDRRPDLRGIGDIELSYLFGGPKRVADTLYVVLACHGAARLDAGKIVIEVATPDLSPQLEAFRSALLGTRARGCFQAMTLRCELFQAMLERLTARKVLLDDQRRLRLKLATWCPAFLLLVFGFAAAMVDVSRDRDVGILLLLMTFVFVGVAALWRRERYLTRETMAALEALRASRSRALRAPRAEEVAFAFAMVGVAALDGTAQAGYAKLIKFWGGV